MAWSRMLPLVVENGLVLAYLSVSRVIRFLDNDK